MFRGTVPKTQPRTARSNAEQKGTTPSGFVEGVEYNAQAGAPRSMVGANDSYRDSAIEDAQKQTSRPDLKAPFVVTRGRK